MKVPELFPIDPSGGYFESPLQGFRWSSSGYVPIKPGRGPGLPSEVLGLNLQREGYALRLYDPATGRKLPTPGERFDEAESMRAQIEKARRLVAAELELAETRRQLTENNLKLTEAPLKLAETQIEQLMAENERHRRENEVLRHRFEESGWSHGRISLSRRSLRTGEDRPAHQSSEEKLHRAAIRSACCCKARWRSWTAAI